MRIATKVLELLLGDEPAQPRLTWYGTEDERVELSGRVLANWVTKATNMLADEGEVEPGSRVLLDVPVHWRALVWSLGTWAAGGELVLPADSDDDGAVDDEDPYKSEDPYDPDGDGADAAQDADDDESEFVADLTENDPDVVITSRAMAAPTAGLVLAIALPALAMRVNEPIPAGALDAAASLMGYGDDLGFVQEPDGDDIALSGADVDGSGPDGSVSYDELEAWSSRQTPASHRNQPGARVLCTPGTLAEMLAHAVAAWRTGGSMVLLHDDVPRARFDGIAAAERATVRC